MRILVANKFFYNHGGPESVLAIERNLLRDAGHDVIDFSMQDPRNWPSAYAGYFAPPMDLQSVRPTPASLRTAWRFLDSSPAAGQMRRLVRDHRPDVAHLHSVNHQLTPSVIRVLRGQGIPVVVTLHDYKLVCPAYTMLANGAICERCSGGRFYRATTTRCRGAARSPLLTAESYLQHRLRRSYDGVARFLSPSRFLAEKFADMGFRYPVRVLPNPSIASRVAGAGPREASVLFVGRVVPEKGLRTLCAAALRSGVRVRIAGDGPQLLDLHRDFEGQGRIEFLGRVEPHRAQQLMAESRAVAVPSEWYENQPMVILEAFAQHTPVIASDLGGNPELVRDRETGVLYPAGDVAALSASLRYAVDHPAEMEAMGQRGAEFAADFSPEKHLQRLLGVFSDVLTGDAEPQRQS